MASGATRVGKILGLEGDVEGFVNLHLFRVIAKKSVPSVMNEKNLLASL